MRVLGPLVGLVGAALKDLQDQQVRHVMGERIASGLRSTSAVTRCLHPGCKEPGRYSGRCMAHWKEATPEEQIASAKID